MKQTITLMLLIFCTGCASPTKVGTEARAMAHQRMDVMNADLAAQQAKQQFEVGQLDKALETIDAALARFNENAEYHLLRGRILIELHSLDAAKQSLSSAIELAPDSAEAYYFVGVLHQRWSEDDGAIAAYKKAMQNDPSHPQYFMAVAESHVALGQLDDAVQLLLHSGKEFQHQPAVPALLGQIYLLKGESDVAAKYLADARLLGDDGVETLTSLASAQFDAAMYAQCLTTLQLLQDSVDLSPIHLRMKGKCLFSTGRMLQGRDICLEVSRKTPEDPSAWLDLGYIAWHMGDYERLGRCGKHLTQLNPAIAEGSLFEGIAAFHAGDDGVAQEKLQSLQSDNTIGGLGAILATISAKRAKTAVETAIGPNMAPDFAEGASERHEIDTADGGQPLVGVAPHSTHAP